MSRFFPNREERQTWSPIQWMTYIGGVIGVLTFLGVSGNWVVEQYQRLTAAEPNKRLAAPTRRLGLVVEQDGAQVSFGPEEVAGRYYSAAFVLKPKAFRIGLPLGYCGTPDTLPNEAVALRIEPPENLPQLLQQLEMPNDKVMREVFPSGSGYAAGSFAQTEMYFEHPRRYEDLWGFNAIFGDRFADVDDKRAWITLNAVVNISDDTDFLSAGKPFIAAIGLFAAHCKPTEAPPVELLSFAFE